MKAIVLVEEAQTQHCSDSSDLLQALITHSSKHEAHHLPPRPLRNDRSRHTGERHYSRQARNNFGLPLQRPRLHWLLRTHSFSTQRMRSARWRLEQSGQLSWTRSG